MALEVFSLATWAYAQLAANTAVVTGTGGRIGDTEMYQTATYPYAVFEFIEPGLTIIVQGLAVSGINALLQATAVGKGTLTAPINYSDLATIANGIDAALHGLVHYVTFGGGKLKVVSTRRRTLKLPPEEESGERFLRMGAEYEIHAQPIV